jgi:hypothetical protein
MTVWAALSWSSAPLVTDFMKFLILNRLVVLIYKQILKIQNEMVFY